MSDSARAEAGAAGVLEQLRCALGQGLYLSAPLEGDAVETEVLARFQPWPQGRTRREADAPRGR